MGDVMHEMQQPGHQRAARPAATPVSSTATPKAAPDPHGAALGAVIPGVLVRWSSITVLLITARVSAQSREARELSIGTQKEPPIGMQKGPLSFRFV